VSICHREDGVKPWIFYDVAISNDTTAGQVDVVRRYCHLFNALIPRTESGVGRGTD
jgi:hypothetical protein